jgi:opacity protein-like surface antigen
MKKVLFVIALLCMVSLSSAQVGFKGIGAHLGYVDPEDPISGTIGFGAQADLGTLMPQLGLFAYVDYWGKSYDYYYGSVDFSDIDIAAIVKYYFPGKDFKPYAGGGLGLNFASASYNSDLGHVDESGLDNSSTNISIHLLGGVQKKLSPTLDGFAEIKYSMADADYLSIFVGVTYKLNK